MTDVVLPSPGLAASWRVTPSQLYLVAFAVFLILGAVNLSLVRAKAERDNECDLRPGSFASGFSNGFQGYSCECSSQFHFAEACPTPTTMLPPNFAPGL
jgi:hypothetical protein